MAFTQTQLDALEAAIATGTLTVEYADKKVTYRSLDEMIKIREMMRKALGDTSPLPTRVVISADKGLGRC